eukprot:m.34116 g.34116  ORF g.34116 m.34116 type:complete len:275 (+) comp31948_c0_seq8:562-1386(+)
MAISAVSRFANVFGRSRGAAIGMIHVAALPGSPRHRLPMTAIVEKATREAEIYKSCGLHGVLVENIHDIPYLNSRVGPEIVACMTAVCEAVKQTTRLPCGIQILAGANTEALAVAKAVGLDFIRAEGFVFAHVADEGMVNACAGELLRYRKVISAEEVLIFTDIKKKHSSHAVTADVSIAETAQAAEMFLSDGVIVTGSATGSAASPEEVSHVLASVKGPVLIGSGVSVANVADYQRAHGLIIGSHFKKDGLWQNDVERSHVQRFMEKMQDDIY